MNTRRSSLSRWAVGLILPALFLLAIPSETRAARRSQFSMEILVDGRPLQEYSARDSVYVEAREGREYSIRLRNHTGRRIAVALSVDGLNSIDAKATTMRDASKWVLDPYRTVVIDGWQTGPSTARRFFFTTEDRSYGAWLGKTANLGVVSAAVFRERRPEPVTRYRREKISRDSAGGRVRGGEAEASAQAPHAEAERKDASAEGLLSDEMAATGIGREVGHSVRRIALDLESSPAAVVELRYEYRDALVRLGVLPPEHDPIARRERAHGFEDMEFAPDPFRVDR